MTTPDTRHDDREALSALFDGELEADARRFAMRRLAHDTDWQDTCGQWQLIGDAMRRQAPLAAPADFAARVAGMVEAEAPAVPVEPARRPWAMRRWVGGAVAASVALAAVLATSPFSTGPSGGPAAQPVVAAVPAQGGALPAVAGQPERIAGVAAVDAGAPQAPEPASPGSVRADEPATRTARARPEARIASVPASARGSGQPAPTRTAPVAVPAAMQAAEAIASASNPFSLSPGQDIVARPWPRSVLSERPVAFTASYGPGTESEGQRPSFYPFEPRLDGDPGSPAPAP